MNLLAENLMSFSRGLKVLSRPCIFTVLNLNEPHSWGVFPSYWHWACELCVHLANEEWLAIWIF